MPTLNHPARVPDNPAARRPCPTCSVPAVIAPGAAGCDTCHPRPRPVPAAAGKPPALRPEDFTDYDLADLSYAGSGFAAAIADIAHHQIGDPGFWDCYGTGPAELARLRDALDQMAAAIRTARIEAARVERRARRRAVRRTRQGRG